jgi:hypothetical protein
MYMFAMSQRAKLDHYGTLVTLNSYLAIIQLNIIRPARFEILTAVLLKVHYVVLTAVLLKVHYVVLTAVAEGSV